MKHYIRTAVITAAILAVSACVYPFDPAIEGDDSRLVVEGDIHIGSTSTFSFSRVYPLNKEFEYKGMDVNGYIEGENGTRVSPSPVAPGQLPDSYTYFSAYLSFDTSNLPADQRYRIHFEDKATGESYESDWLEVNPAPAIDSLSYILNEERGELNVALSMHCEGHSYFRWSYDETWEYHSEAHARAFYDVEANSVRQFKNGENTYYCWRNYHSPVIKVFSTAEQADDRFVDLEFHRVRRNDTRLQILYNIKVHLEAISEDAYKYWNNIRQNSEGQGTIFSPTPSMMAGNIHCISNPDIPVIGYIGAAAMATASMFYDNEKERFYKSSESTEFEMVEVEPDRFQDFWKNGFAPFDIIRDDPAADPKFEWAPRRCVDCRLSGGTKNKPADWPNEHK